MSPKISETGVRPLTSLELTPTLRRKAGEAFNNDAAIKDEPVAPLDQLAVAMGTGYVDGDGKLRHSGTAFDPFNVFAHRERVIQDLVNKDFEKLKTGYNSGSDKYTTLSWWDRHINKVTDDDITKGLALHSAGAREHDTAYQAAYSELTPEQKANVDTLTSIDTVLKKGKNNKDIKDLRTKIEKMTGGADALLDFDQSGKPVSLSALQGVATKLKPLQQDYRAAEEGILASESSRDLNTQQIEASKARTALEARQEFNNHAIQLAEIEYNNKTNDYNWRTANADRDYQWRSDEADRDLKATLTQLGYEDKADERALSRENRAAENRQLMLLQLIKGLGNLGGSL